MHLRRGVSRQLGVIKHRCNISALLNSITSVTRTLSESILSGEWNGYPKGHWDSFLGSSLPSNPRVAGLPVTQSVDGRSFHRCRHRTTPSYFGTL